MLSFERDPHHPRRGACLSGRRRHRPRARRRAAGPRPSRRAPARSRPFRPATWDALAAANPWATPFSAWAFQRAWWDALRRQRARPDARVVDADAPADGPRRPVAIVPLMHRHEVEPIDADDPHDDAPRRHDADLTPVAARPPRPSSSAPRTTPTTRRSWRPRRTCRRSPRRSWPTSPTTRPSATTRPGTSSTSGASAAATRRPTRSARRSARARSASGWTLNVEREDVCPVVTLPRRASTSTATSRTLGKKERHEIRRKIRRAEAAGEIRLDDSTDPLADLDAFIDLHQKRWGADGPLPADRRRRPEPRSSSAACSSCSAPDGPVRAHVPDGRRPADRGRDPLRDARTATSTTTPASTPTRATSRRASSWSRAYVQRAIAARQVGGSTSCAATSPTSTSGARSTSRSSASSSAADPAA